MGKGWARLGLICHMDHRRAQEVLASWHNNKNLEKEEREAGMVVSMALRQKLTCIYCVSNGA